MTPCKSILYLLLAGCLLVGRSNFSNAEDNKPAALQVTLAELEKDPAKFQGKLIQVEGLVQDTHVLLKKQGDYEHRVILGKNNFLWVWCAGKLTVNTGDNVRITGEFRHQREVANPYSLLVVDKNAKVEKAPAPEVKPLKGTALSRAIEAFDKVGGAYGVRLLGGDEFAAKAKKLGFDARAYYEVRSLAFGRITGKKALGDDGLAALAEHIGAFPGLDVLDLRGNDLTAKGLKTLPPLPKLQKLTLDGEGITDEAVADAAARFPSLTKFELHNTAVTAAGEAALRKLLPKCEINRVSSK